MGSLLFYSLSAAAMKPQRSSKKQHVTGQLWPYFKFHQLGVKHFPMTRQISYFRDGNDEQ